MNVPFITSEKLNQILGYYIPNRFTINVDGDLDNMSNETFTVFIHEYTHLLQNIFTIFGWLSFSHETIKVGWLHDVYRQEKAYRVPLLREDWSDDLRTRLQRIYGFRAYQYDTQGISGQESVENPDGPEPLKSEIRHIYHASDQNERTAVYRDFLVNGKKREIELNFYILCESMAYIVEKHYGIASIDSPDFPYNILSLVFKGTSLESHLDRQIVIIYLSLQTFTPESTFKDLLERAEQLKVEPDRDIHYFTNALLNCTHPHFSEGMDNQLGIIRKYLQDYVKRLQEYELSKDYVAWLLDAFSAFEKHIREDILHFLKPIIHKNKSNMIINQMDFDYFFLIAEDGQISAVRSDSPQHTHGMIFHTSLFHCIDYLIEFGAKRRSCPILNNCDLAEKDLDCTNAPYVHGRRKPGEFLCEYGIAAHFLGVHESRISFTGRS